MTSKRSTSSSAKPGAAPLDLEAGLNNAPPEAAPAPAAAADRPGRPIVELVWTELIMGFCFASALQIAALWCQIQSKLVPNMEVVSMAIVLSFSSIFVSKYIATKFPQTALVLRQFGVLFTVTAFFAAITVPLNKPLLILAWLLYAVSFITIAVCRSFF